MRRKLGANDMAMSASLHFANRNATKAGKTGLSLHFANGIDAGHRLELVSASLHDAAVELESMLPGLPGPDEQADLHEAIGSIMETLQLIAATHARLGPAAAD